MPYQKCDRCDGWLKVRLYTDNNGKIATETYGNYTTNDGGLFCSTGCALSRLVNPQETNNSSVNVKYDINN